MMRALIKSSRLIYSQFRYHEVKRVLSNANPRLFDLKYDTHTYNCGHSSHIFSRAMSADAAKVNYEG